MGTYQSGGNEQEDAAVLRDDPDGVVCERNRERVIRRTWMSSLPVYFLYVCFLLMAAIPASGGEGERHNLTLLHTNDLGGRLLPEVYFDEPEHGGFARLLSVLRSQTVPDHTLILDGGGALGITPLTGFDQGCLVAELMKSAGYTAVVPGNHEFDYGLDTLRTRIQEMGCPMLAANLKLDEDVENPFQSWIRVDQEGLGIAIIGLLDPGIAQVINPHRNPGIRITEPGAELQQILPQLREEVDYIIALLHMEEDQAIQLAKGFPEVNLFLAGGFQSAPHKGAVPHLIELANGVRILTTPGQSAFVGRVDVELRKSLEGIEEVSFSARLVPVGVKVEPDSGATVRIEQLSAVFSQAGQEPLGYIGTVENTPQLVVETLRSALRAEVGVLNQGCLHPVALGDTVTREDIRRLVRFDNLLVTLDATGKELAEIAARNQKNERYGQKLVYAGYDPDAGKINGRKLINDETYTVVTTVFLAEGGDAYFAPRRQQYREQSEISLSQAVVEYFRRLPGKSEHYEPKYGVWKTRSKMSGSLTWTDLNDRAAAYNDVAFLSGRSALAWNSLVDARMSYETPTGSWVHLLKSSFGQVRTQGRLEEAADRLQVDVIYTRETFSPAPFVSLALNTVWTTPKGGERPLGLRGSLGLHRVFTPNAKMRIGLGVERDFAAEKSEWGLEASPEYRRKFAKENSFSSTMKLFLGVTETRTVSIQHYTTLAIHLFGDLYATLDANFFMHRSSAVGDMGIKSEIQAGLGYTWNGKWF